MYGTPGVWCPGHYRGNLQEEVTVYLLALVAVVGVVFLCSAAVVVTEYYRKWRE